MRDFLLGIVALTAFGFLVLWTLSPLPHAPAELADARSAQPERKLALPAPKPPAPEPAPAPAKTAPPPPVSPAPVVAGPVASPAPAPAPVEAAAATASPEAPGLKMETTQPVASPNRGRRIREVGQPKPARASAAKAPIFRPAQKPAPAHPAPAGKKPIRH